MGHSARSFATTNSLQTDLQGHSINYQLPPFSTFDASLGLSKDAWSLQAYGQNLADHRGELTANYFLFYKSVTVTRPRTIGLRISYHFGRPQK